MLEFLLEVVGEFLLQALIEALAEIGLHSLVAPFRKQASPWLAAFGYALFGATLGGVSLLLFPASFVPIGFLRVLNLVVTPVLVGALMSVIGLLRARRGRSVLRIDTFVYGFLFALGLGVVRFVWAE